MADGTGLAARGTSPGLSVAVALSVSRFRYLAGDSARACVVEDGAPDAARCGALRLPPMTPEYWQRIKELFNEATEYEPAARARFLGESCAGDLALLAQVESLIASDEEAGDFMAGPAFLPPGAASAEADEDAGAAGRRVGSYEIVRELGRGGMGTVYLGARADAQFDKRVAIKVVKRGMDTDFVLRRFGRERQVLAALDHPNIAKLLDGGATEDGLPYFVMEYIEGESITHYCDGRRLPVKERLKLFRQVCSAVQYAHQNLIVHRDMKPSNILVTAEGAPKLLDFGIAKLLDPALQERTVDQTGAFVRLMTPEYASPEQVRGLPVTTASDVYSLGVLLYELLTGCRPYRVPKQPPEEVARVVCGTEPGRPSTAVGRTHKGAAYSEWGEGRDAGYGPGLTPETAATSRNTRPERLRRRLAGDLDNIVLKALRKEPQRRYASAEQLSEDIRRHLEGLPVTARRDTLAYRASKFVRRRRVEVAAAALITLSLAAGLAATVWQARVAQAERARAERRFNDVRRLANSFLFEFHDSIKDLPGATPARELLVKRALEYLDSLSQEAHDDPALQRELATAYEKVGDLQGQTLNLNTGDTAGALASYGKALQLRESLFRADPGASENRRALADSHNKLGMLLWQTSERDAALDDCRKAIAIYEQLVSASPHDRALLGDLAGAYLNAGMILLEQGDTDAALRSQQRALALYEQLVASDPRDRQARRSLSRSYEKLGNVLLQEGNAGGALEFNRKALALRTELAAEDPANADFKRGVEISHEKIGDMLTRLGDFRGALESYRQELTICQSLADADPANAQLRSELSSPYERLGETFARLGQPARALAYHRRALAIREELAAADASNVPKRWDVIESSAKTARLLAVVGEEGAALEACRKTESLAEATPDFPRDVFYRAYRAAAYAELGGAYAALAARERASAGLTSERRREARSWYQKSLDIYQDLAGRSHISERYAHEIDDVTRGIKECD
jgi:non-specific serine/threonine protein kinase/serine/threonine-protein kinase